MHWLAILLLIILMLIVAMLMYNAYTNYKYLNNIIIPNLPKLQITPEAKQIFTEYINTHDVARQHEQQCSKIADITIEPEKYFRIELRERDHRDVVYLLEQNNWVMNEAMMRLWRQENYRENYIKKKVQCD